MGLGWGNLAGGIGEVIGKVATYIPGQVERWKNELDKLEREKSELLIFKATIENAKRMRNISNRIDQLNRLLANKSKD